MPIIERDRAVNWWMVALVACGLWLSFLFGFVAAAIMAASRQGEAKMTIVRLQEEVEYLRSEPIENLTPPEPDDW